LAAHLLLLTFPAEPHNFGGTSVAVNIPSRALQLPLPSVNNFDSFAFQMPDVSSFPPAVSQRAELPCWVCDGQLAPGKALLDSSLCNHFGSVAAGNYRVWYSERARGR
jgi:hypothetical protein